MNKILSDFNKFEKIYEDLSTHTKPETVDINEGILSGVMNFFSRVFGGKIDSLDSILRKYKNNEKEYWSKWADANHQYNMAAAKRDTADTETAKRKYLELMERANKLISQTNKSRNDVNNALERQAQLLIRTNKRLRNYWDMKKAKVDEEVAKNSYKTLKDKVDEDVLNDLYKRMEETEKRAKNKVKNLPKNIATIDFGNYKDASSSEKMVPFREFGIHDLDDFIFSDEKLWDERVKLMPRSNLIKLDDHIAKTLADMIDVSRDQIKKLKSKLADAKDEEKPGIEREIKFVEKYFDSDSDLLNKRRLSLIKDGSKSDDAGKIEKKEDANVDSAKEETAKEPENAKEKPESKKTISSVLDDMSDKLAKKISDKGDVDEIKQYLVKLADKLPEQDKDEEKELAIRAEQLVDFSKDVVKFKKDNNINGKLSDGNLNTLLQQFKKEFPL